MRTQEALMLVTTAVAFKTGAPRKAGLMKKLADAHETEAIVAKRMPSA
jgi:hypothetical protein